MRIYKRRTEDLSRTEAIAIVRAMREILWPHNDVSEEWSPDHLEWLADTLMRHRLGPTAEAMNASQKRRYG